MNSITKEQLKAPKLFHQSSTHEEMVPTNINQVDSNSNAQKDCAQGIDSRIASRVSVDSRDSQRRATIAISNPSALVNTQDPVSSRTKAKRASVYGVAVKNPHRRASVDGSVMIDDGEDEEQETQPLLLGKLAVSFILLGKGRKLLELM